MADSPTMPEAVREHLALALVPGLGPKLTAALLERFGTATAARRATATELLAIPHIGEKLAGSLAAAMRSVNIEPELQLMEKHGARVVPLGFPGYPPPLASVPAPPPLLYFRGEWIEADANAVGIVGSRSCTPYGLKVAEQLARGLARAGFTIISGLARGIDGAAHRAALEAGGRTVAARWPVGCRGFIRPSTATWRTKSQPVVVASSPRRRWAWTRKPACSPHATASSAD